MSLEVTFNWRGREMPDKDEKFYIGAEEDGTRVFWIPYNRMT